MNDDENARAARYQAMEQYRAQEDRRNCTEGGPHHHNQYFDRNKGYWICPDCGGTSRQASLWFLAQVIGGVILGFVMIAIAFFISKWLGHSSISSEMTPEIRAVLERPCTEELRTQMFVICGNAVTP